MAAMLVLWDIDHTLIETRGVGGEIYAEAFQAVTGQPLNHIPALSGRTEPVIFREALQTNSVTSSGDLYQRFAAEQARGYASRAGELRRRGRVLPGAENALHALAEPTMRSARTSSRSPASTPRQPMAAGSMQSLRC